MATTPTPSKPTKTTPLEVKNPAGPPEGVQESSGAPDGHQTPTGPPDTVQPTTAEVTPTPPTEEDATTGEHPGTHRGTEEALGRLYTYLQANHPADMSVSEHLADTAVRLLTRLSASAPVRRCEEPYCNLPTGHAGEHGWVHVEPR